jgi:hypothetical protein
MMSSGFELEPWWMEDDVGWMSGRDWVQPLSSFTRASTGTIHDFVHQRIGGNAHDT